MKVKIYKFVRSLEPLKEWRFENNLQKIIDRNPRVHETLAEAFQLLYGSPTYFGKSYLLTTGFRSVRGK